MSPPEKKKVPPSTSAPAAVGRLMRFTEITAGSTAFMLRGLERANMLHVPLVSVVSDFEGQVYMCPHTTICVLILLYVSSYYYTPTAMHIEGQVYMCICVYVYMCIWHVCPETTYVSRACV